MKRFCESNLLVLVLVVLLTILVVYISLNSLNATETFTGCNRNSNGYYFPNALLSSNLQGRVNNMVKENVNEEDNTVLSQRHINQVYQTRRPELIQQSPISPRELCYINLENM